MPDPEWPPRPFEPASTTRARVERTVALMAMVGLHHRPDAAAELHERTGSHLAMQRVWMSPEVRANALDGDELSQRILVHAFVELSMLTHALGLPVFRGVPS